MDGAGWTSDREHPGHDGREGRVVASEGFGCGGLAGNVLTVAGMGGGGLEENEGSVEARVSGGLFTRLSESCVSGKMVMRGG